MDTNLIGIGVLAVLLLVLIGITLYNRTGPTETSQTLPKTPRRPPPTPSADSITVHPSFISLSLVVGGLFSEQISLYRDLMMSPPGSRIYVNNLLMRNSENLASLIGNSIPEEQPDAVRHLKDRLMTQRELLTEVLTDEEDSERSRMSEISKNNNVICNDLTSLLGFDEQTSSLLLTRWDEYVGRVRKSFSLQAKGKPDEALSGLVEVSSRIQEISFIVMQGIYAGGGRKA